MNKGIRRKLTLVLLILCITLTALMFVGCNSEPSPPTPTTYTVAYSADFGGSITGEKTQIVESGRGASTVTAVASKGYEFDSWSDGVETAQRADSNVTADISVSASFKRIPVMYTLTYIAGEHGNITGETTQIIEYGNNGTEVTASPDVGYAFSGWSDGVETARRQDLFVNGNKNVTASFTAKTVTFPLNYASGISGSGVTEVTFTGDNYNSRLFPVPTKEHFTFDGWFIGQHRVHSWLESTWFSADNDERVTEADGQAIIGGDIFDCDPEGKEIYAKWKANETFTYKLLIVYVTRVDANLPPADKTPTLIHVDYTMSALERRFCQATTKQLKRVLDGMMDGLVDFQIDEYYTKETVVTENFTQPSLGPTRISNSLDPTQIPEVQGMLNNYQSALSIHSLDDRADQLHSSSGSAGAKYGEVFFDLFLNGIYANDISIEDMLADLDRQEWENWLETPIHELSHTIEMRINAYDYHESCVNMMEGDLFVNAIQANKLYYLQEIDIDGVKVGIPYRFWKGEIATVTYAVDGGDGGYISGRGWGVFDHKTGNQVYEVVYGDDAQSVIAEPDSGYRFVRWSDGVMSAERMDQDIAGNFTVTAYFEPIEYTVHIIAGEGGTVTGEISGLLQINIIPGSNSKIYFNAIADEGYHFVGWSDGTTNTNRYFKVDIFTVKLFDQNHSLTITALFEKII